MDAQYAAVNSIATKIAISSKIEIIRDGHSEPFEYLDPLAICIRTNTPTGDAMGDEDMVV